MVSAFQRLKTCTAADISANSLPGRQPYQFGIKSATLLARVVIK
jgi:hypothetical protein